MERIGRGVIVDSSTLFSKGNVETAMAEKTYASTCILNAGSEERKKKDVCMTVYH